jgi:iron complex transport system ATP-binding protein
LIELEDVTVVRDGRRVLDSINLRIEQGEHVAILGPNGCGKSTLIKAFCREIYPHAGHGKVEIDGRNRWLVSELRTILGVVSEEPREPLLGSPTGLEMVLSGLIGTYGVTVQHEITPEMWEQAQQALVRVEASHLGGQAVETMSTGERRRVFIARALVCNPKALVLDEPTTGLDMKASNDFQSTARRLAQDGTALILVTHHLDEIIPEIDRIVMLKSGRIFADGGRELLNRGILADLFSFPDLQIPRY